MKKDGEGKTQSGSEAIPDGGFLQTLFKPKKLKALFVRLKTPDEEGFFELYSYTADFFRNRQTDSESVFSNNN